MSYTGTTWLQLKQALLTRLGDSVFYTDNTATLSEAGSYLAEALYVWQAAAHFWKQRIAFNTAASITWYDLTTITTNPATLMANTLTDRRLLGEIQYHLIETLNLTGWTGTEMFTLAEVVSAIQRRRNQFLFETGITLERTQLNVGPPPADGRFMIPVDASSQPIIDVRRLAWFDTLASRYTQLWREDEWSLNLAIQAWRLNPGTPQFYSVATTPPLQVQFVPVPSGIGQLEVIGVYDGANLDVSAGVLLGVPDNFAWVIKWGTLADLLGREGQARDPQRAQYCERRWREGVELARLYSPMLFAAIQSVPVQISSVHDFDAYRSGWQNTTATRPTDLLAEGANLFAFYPTPDAVYGVDADVLIPAPVPAADGDFIQLGPEEQDVILDYAQHIGAFKEAGEEFAATTAKYENLIRLAAQYNEKLRATTAYKTAIEDRMGVEEMERPRRVPQGGVRGGGG